MKVSELLFEEPGKVHARKQDKKPEPRGAPEGWGKARVFDKKGEKNRSLLRKMHGDRNQFFATGDMEYYPPDDDMALPYNPGFHVLVMSGNGDIESGLWNHNYSGISVFFPWNGGEPEGHTFDKRAEKEWNNPKTREKILAVAKKAARENLPDYMGGGIDKMVDLEDNDRPEMKELRDKLAKRGFNKQIKKMLGD